MSEAEVIWPEPSIRKERLNAPLSEEEVIDRYRWLWQFINLNFYSPSYEVIAQGWGVSKGAVKNTLEKLAERQWIEQLPGPRVIKCKVNPFGGEFSDNANVAENVNHNPDVSTAQLTS